MATVLRKQALRVGVFQQPDGFAYVTPDTVQTIRKGTQALSGYRSPLWLEHPVKGERKNYPVKIGSELEKTIERDPFFAGWSKPVMDGAEEAMDCDLAFESPDLAKKFEENGGMVSPQYGPWTDDEGVTHECVLHHVAVTPRAVDKGQNKDFKPVKAYDVALSEVRFSLVDAIDDSVGLATALGKLKARGIGFSEKSVLTLPLAEKILAAFEGQSGEQPPTIQLSTANKPMADTPITPTAPNAPAANAVTREDLDKLTVRLSEADAVIASQKNQNAVLAGQLTEQKKKELTGRAEVALSEGRMPPSIGEQVKAGIATVDALKPETFQVLEVRLSDADLVPAGTFFSPEQRAKANANVQEVNVLDPMFAKGDQRISHERADELIKGAN